MSLQNLLALVVLFAVLPLVGWLMWKQYQRRLDAWRTFAQRHGWGFNNTLGSMEVEGLYQGQQLSLLTEQRGSGKSRYTVAVVRLDVSHALPVELSLEPEGLGDRFLKLVGMKDEELGDAVLDEAFDLKHLSPDARAVLRAPRVVQPLLRLARVYKRFSIEGGLLEVEQRGMPGTTEALESLVAPVLELADALGTVAANPEEQMRG